MKSSDIVRVLSEFSGRHKVWALVIIALCLLLIVYVSRTVRTILIHGKTRKEKLTFLVAILFAFIVAVVFFSWIVYRADQEPFQQADQPQVEPRKENKPQPTTGVKTTVPHPTPSSGFSPTPLPLPLAARIREAKQDMDNDDYVAACKKYVSIVDEFKGLSTNDQRVLEVAREGCGRGHSKELVTQLQEIVNQRF